ncbi:putative amino acid sensor-independent protein [Thozetella sp. PMI_491]|nr:putative amino acid sensor-independent protein [Thozetella sp. PMI_491]
MASAPPAFANSSWHNFTLWTAQHLGYAVNMSKLAPSFEDLVWAGPRMVMKLGKLGSFISFPDAIDGFGQRVIPESTDAGVFHATTTGTGMTGSFLAESTPAVADVLAAEQDPNAFVARFSLEGAKGLGSVFSYATSKWALVCIAMAVVFNRTHIFAATRRRLRLRWPIRLALRIMPLVLLILHARRLLQSIQCQTSPDFGELRWGNASKSSDLMFTQTNSFLHGLSSTILFGATDKESCESVRMVPWDDQEQPELRGSLSRLWPLFGTFCLSQFVEVVSCTVQGRPVSAETGMTLFEHSLAFAEADAAISNQLGWGLFANGSNSTASGTLGSNIAITRAMIMKRVNTPAEVLLVAFLSSMSHITSHLLGLFNLQSKFRLVNTGLWGLSFMGSIVWSAFTFSIDDASAQGLLRYPTVCIIGFIPHVLVLAGIFVCCFIYCLALLLSALATPENTEIQHMTLMQRLAHAHNNMQANVSLSDIRIRMDMDFYTALLRAGFGAITMASEAVYLNEDRRVNLKRYTWLEDERFREIEELRMQWIGGGIPGSRFDSVGTIGLVPIKDGQMHATSGYAREKAVQKIAKPGGNKRIRDGVGAAERSGRWLMALEYIMHINRLMLTAWALMVVKVLSFVGIRNSPRWLVWLAQRPKVDSPNSRRSNQQERGPATAEWMSPGPGSYNFIIPRTDRVDVEVELRRRLRNSRPGEPGDRLTGEAPINENELDSRLYTWWLKGGWWGTADNSGDYVPPANEDPEDEAYDPDWDTTSIISTTETHDSEAGWESDPEDASLDDGQRTPTQDHPHPNPFTSGAPNPFSALTRESTPLHDSPMDMADLARLLHPASPEDREDARALAAHLNSDGIMTRSRFRQHEQRQRAQVLLSHAGRFSLSSDAMGPEEETRRLEQILLSRRSSAAARAASGAGEAGVTEGAGTWATGAAGLGPDGPQCVVCQSAPRTIIVWPCRCLSLCDDCRVSLAMNNFDKCVCCRREVISFSRIYVP